MNTHRERLEIINDMLKVISDNKNIGITNLTHKANLSTPDEKKYETKLIDKGFIKKIILPKGSIKGRLHKRESIIFEITDKGKEYLEFYRKFTAFKEKYDL